VPELPEIPIDPINPPTSIDLTDEDNTYPLLESIVGPPNPDSVGPEAGNRQPRALDLRTETLREAVNKLIEVTNSLNENLLHRDGASAVVDGSLSPSYMRGDLDMGDDPLSPSFHRVINMADGVDDTDAVTKQQLDTLSAFLNSLQNQLNGALKTNGTNQMLAPLNMGGFRVEFLGDPVNVADAVNKGTMDTELDQIRADYVRRDGGNTMIGNLDLGGFKIVNMNLAIPSNDGDGVSRGYLLQVLSDIAATPPGAIAVWAGSEGAVPTGWLLCAGQTVSQATFANLFAVVGTTYNIGGEPGGEFRLPDLRGRVPVGLDNMGGSSANVLTSAQADILGGTLGEEFHTLTLDEIASHTHQYDDRYVAVATGGAEEGPSVVNATSDFVTLTGQVTDPQGNDNPHNNVQPSIAMNFIIKI
jgi:microcystin-dependent protein